jgi:hypothetical protein
MRTYVSSSAGSAAAGAAPASMSNYKYISVGGCRGVEWLAKRRESAGAEVGSFSPS